MTTFAGGYNNRPEVSFQIYCDVSVNVATGCPNPTGPSAVI